MSIEATAWLDGETTDTLAGGSPATPADPTPWGGDELDSSAALPEIVPEGGTPTPIPPTDPTRNNSPTKRTKDGTANPSRSAIERPAAITLDPTPTINGRSDFPAA
jgi:hypothetical protein